MRLVLVGILMMIAGLFASASAPAAVFTVDSTGQEADAAPGNGACRTAQGACTLRAALAEANGLVGADEVNVPPGTYPVTTWTPTISQTLTLRGTEGARLTRLDSGGTGQNWTISGGGTVVVEGLTFTGVNGTGSAVIVNGPDTTLREISIENNRATASNGAGLRIQTGQVDLIRSAITDNQVDRTSGDAMGGGILLSAGSLTAVSTTIARNTAKSSALASAAWGGGIMTNGHLALRHVTLRENSSQSGSAANYAGNLYVSTSGQATVRDSILTGGSTSSGQSRNCGISSSGAVLTVTGRNIYESLGNFSCSFPPGTVAGTSAPSTPPGDHGGTGLTYVPLVSSAAFDAASDCPDDGLDQRGVKAPTGAACDIGAAELGADLRVQLTGAPGPVAPGAAVFHTAVLSNNGLDTTSATTLALTPAAGLSILSVSDGTCTAGGLCSFGTLAPGMSRTVTFSAKAPSNGPLVTRAVGSSEIPDPTPEDATTSLTTAIVGPPVITKLRSIGKLRAGKRGRIGLNLSREATVRIVVSRISKGRRTKGKCSPKATKGKTCQTLKKVGVLTAKHKAGAAKVNLPARLGGRKLTPGRYRLTATATAPDGLRSKTTQATVKVLKARTR